MENNNYKVTAQAFNRVDGSPVCVARTEVIDVSTNTIFEGAKNVMDVRRQYEAFWNDLDETSEEVVFVQGVRRL